MLAGAEEERERGVARPGLFVFWGSGEEEDEDDEQPGPSIPAVHGKGTRMCTYHRVQQQGHGLLQHQIGRGEARPCHVQQRQQREQEWAVLRPLVLAAVFDCWVGGGSGGGIGGPTNQPQQNATPSIYKHI